MFIKYYGCDLQSSDAYFALPPYRYIPLSPSYCVWFVPGSYDCDGNSLEVPPKG